VQPITVPTAKPASAVQPITVPTAKPASAVQPITVPTAKPTSAVQPITVPTAKPASAVRQCSATDYGHTNQFNGLRPQARGNSSNGQISQALQYSTVTVDELAKIARTVADAKETATTYGPGEVTRTPLPDIH
jgi:hypothetical protein